MTPRQLTPIRSMLRHPAWEHRYPTTTLFRPYVKKQMLSPFETPLWKEPKCHPTLNLFMLKHLHLTSNCSQVAKMTKRTFTLQILPEDEDSNVQEDDLSFGGNELPTRFDCGSNTNLDLPADQNRTGIIQNPNSMPRWKLVHCIYNSRH